MQYKNLSIEKIFHAAVKITGQQVIYIDPFHLPDNSTPADLILITHEHHDHLSVEDIKKISNQNTTIIASILCQEKLASLEVKEILYVRPGDALEIGNIKIQAVPAYNINKFRPTGIPFHPEDSEKVGYVIEIDNIKIYHAGDTDNIPEMTNLKNIDLAFLPISGIFVMTPIEAAEAANVIDAKITIPMHYGDYEFNNQLLGPKENAEIFKKLCKARVEII